MIASQSKKIARERLRAYQRKRRIALIERLGGKCVRCGFVDIRALQIDHVNGDGYLERGETTNYLKVNKSLDDNEGRYQLLCANCNWIKRVDNNEVKKCIITNEFGVRMH